MSLVTTCPSCGTVFKMAREQLDASDGWVRCGHCLHIFDAKAQLVQDSDHLLPNTGEIQPDPAHFSFVQQAKQQAFWTTPAMRLTLIFVSGVMLVLLAIQILRFEKDRWAQSAPILHSWSSSLCDWSPCTFVAKRNIEAWSIENSSFQKEPSANNAPAFRLSAQLKNTANTTLLLPHLELSLLDTNEVIIVRQVISLESSLGSTTAGHGEYPVQFLIDPSTTNTNTLAGSISGYRLVLFYP